MHQGHLSLCESKRPYVPGKKVSHLLFLVVVSAAAAGAVGGVGVIAGGGGGHHGGGRVAACVLGVAVAVAAAGHRVHHVKHSQPEEKLQYH